MFVKHSNLSFLILHENMKLILIHEFVIHDTDPLLRSYNRLKKLVHIFVSYTVSFVESLLY